MAQAIIPPFTAITLLGSVNSITPSVNIDIPANCDDYNFVEIDAYIKGSGAADVYRNINITDPSMGGVNFDYSGFRHNGAALVSVAPATTAGGMQMLVNPGNLNTISLCHLNIKIRNYGLSSNPYIEVSGNTYINATTLVQFMYSGRANILGTINTLRITDTGGLNFHADCSYVSRGYK